MDRISLCGEERKTILCINSGWLRGTGVIFDSLLIKPAKWERASSMTPFIIFPSGLRAVRRPLVLCTWLAAKIADDHEIILFDWIVASLTRVVSPSCTTEAMRTVWEIANLRFFVLIHAHMCRTLYSRHTSNASRAWITFLEKVLIHWNSIDSSQSQLAALWMQDTYLNSVLAEIDLSPCLEYSSWPQSKKHMSSTRDNIP